ncbi:hypothetical protein AL064_21075 [Pseudomonas syringae pv. syringae]|uniref:hypothetical protein n=1 Tax=Pseudomonas TaxID=286 RepID=UPI0007608326|nr:MULTISPECIES: hypothetical protein [Pseudomonas]KWS19708.1 hypothetical protein AL064_21075 [Pseudomonas syringae pv. syringae]BBN63833.1 hypothetical protein KUIN1_30230 [Pseudomonas sp. KUIN-1]
MSPDMQLNRKIEEVFLELKSIFPIVEYSKVEDDQFLKIPESGIYFQSSDDGFIEAYRVYCVRFDGYFPADPELKGKYFNINSGADALRELGEPLRNIPSIRIPGIAPTSPGYQFIADVGFVSFYYDPDTDIIRFFHVRVGG